MNGRGAGKPFRLDGNKAAHVVLHVGAVARERRRNQVVLFVCTDEVENRDEFLTLELSQSAPELLDEDDCALSRAHQNVLIDFRNIDAFVEDIHCHNEFEKPFAFARNEAGNGIFSCRLTVIARERKCRTIAFIEIARERLRLALRGNKDKRSALISAVAVAVALFEHVREALGIFEPSEIIDFVLCPSLLVRHPKVRNAEVMERRQEIVFKRLLKTNFIGNVVVEERINIEAVIALRRPRHAEPELGDEVRHDLPVAFRSGAVGFVNDDHVEGVFGEALQHSVPWSDALLVPERSPKV